MQFNCHRNTINNMRQHLTQTGSVGDRARPGRPHVTTARQDRYMTLTHIRQRFKTASSTALKNGISSQTVLNRLPAIANSIRARRPSVGQMINPRNRNIRRLWARRHLRWTRAHWVRVLFSDESRFNLSIADGRVRVFRRRRGERFADNCLLERDTGHFLVVSWYGPG
jgi:hypothetical protein